VGTYSHHLTDVKAVYLAWSDLEPLETQPYNWENFPKSLGEIRARLISVTDERSAATRWMTAGRFLGVLYLLELSLLLLILSLYRVDSKPDFISFLTSSAGLYCSAAVGILLISAGGEAIDLTPCLKEANPSPSFQRGGHYSAQTNTVVAQCLYDELGTRLRVLHINRSKRG